MLATRTHNTCQLCWLLTKPGACHDLCSWSRNSSLVVRHTLMEPPQAPTASKFAASEDGAHAHAAGSPLSRCIGEIRAHKGRRR
jgi:hypothetical protein